MSDFMTLKSGRRVYANRGIFGLEESLNGFWAVTEGYDGGVLGAQDGEALTAEDMREIADLMIDRWTRFRASLV